MESIERFADLLHFKTVEGWRHHIFRLGCEFGFDQTRLAVLPDPNAPIEAEYAFQQSNYSASWLNKYTEEQMHHIDPTFAHCISKSIPQIWSPEIFAAGKPRDMYEEACGYGIKSGVTLPIHGPKGELGIVCLVSDQKPGQQFHRQAIHCLSELACFRDFVFESSLRFIRQVNPGNNNVQFTCRELECLKWSAAGKSSWEIGQMLNCTEATVNFHFSNIRRKFKTKTRQQAIVRAINLGIIHP